ncbi:MAG: hypothetical protein O2973_07465 [Gemmatimonadetes bacterium]|nr:hypothetical protein [Gemmatimonadota bacterium]
MNDLRRLHDARRRYSAADTALKCAVLRSIVSRGVRVRSWAALDRVHDDLLFLCAFPDSPDVLALAKRALGKIEPALRTLRARQRGLADDSGIAGSVSRNVYDYAAARWLATKFPDEVEIDWKAIDDVDPLDTLVAAGVLRAEDDALDDGETGARELLRMASLASGANDLACLLALAPPARDAEELFGRMYDATGVPLRWNLAGSRGSTTHNALAARPAFRTALRRPSSVPARDIAVLLPGIRLAGNSEATRIIDAARATLAARCRDVFATSCANPAEVWIAPLGEGAELAILGLLPHQRVSIEANYGYVLFINGVPAAYGGVSPLYRQANTGINIFAPFRGSEGAFLWTQMLRAFASLFGITRFVVNAFQFGEENEDAVASGAYWFYWRLGFRPDSAKLRALAIAESRRLAAAEARRLAGGKGGAAKARTSARTLRRLAVGDLHLTLPGAARADLFDERWLSTCSQLVTRMLSAAYPLSRDRSARKVAAEVAKTLGARIARWPRAERAAFVRLAPVVALLPSLRRWSAQDKRALTALMRAKGGRVERDFVLRAAAHPRFFPELMGVVEQHRSNDSRAKGIQD